MHPAYPVIETLVNEKLSPGRSAESVQALLACHLELRSEKERRVRIDEKQRATAGGVCRRYSDTIRPAGLCKRILSIVISGSNLRVSVKRLELFQINRL